MENKFIDLNRSFALIDKDHTFDEDENDWSLYFGLSDTKKWSDLFQLNRVVILAEAGSGKTEELKFSTKKLRDNGKQAFFMRLEHINSEFNTSFDIGNHDEFCEWINSDDPGWFFLDSVDEAKLLGPKQFDAAIRKFSANIGDHNQRAHIYITSRISEWLPQSDLSLIKEKLPYYEVEITNEDQELEEIDIFDEQLGTDGIESFKGEKNQIEPTIFALKPLDQEQIRLFSQAYDVQDPDAFISAIERAEAEKFSTRPQDLLDLIDYWNQHGKIENLSKLIETSLSSKLIESDTNRAKEFPLTLEQAKAGAELLAAAVTFQKKSRILVSEQNPGHALKTNVVDIRSVLKTWDEVQIRALLQRPIFDSEIYGTVQFHERRVREFLTASWLHYLLLNGKSRHAIENIFFNERYGIKVLIPSLRPILAWLILLDDHIREIVIKIAPEVCMQGGDPSELPTQIRKNLLEAFCNYYANNSGHHLSFNLAELRRFADSDLSETINSLLSKYSQNEEIRQLLLRIIWQGEIQSCREKAVEFSIASKYDIYTRITGIRAIGAVGTTQQKMIIVKAILNDTDLKNERIIGEVIGVFTEDILSVQNILSIIQRIEEQERYSFSSLNQSLEEFSVHKCPMNKTIEWINGLLKLLKQPPIIERRMFEVSKRYSWLLIYAALAAERMIKNRNPNTFNKNVLEVISLTQTSRDFNAYHSEHHNLANLVPKWSELNYELFWFEVEKTRGWLNKKKNERLIEYWRVSIFNHFWKFTNDDFSMILKDIEAKPLIDDRLVALSLAFQIYVDNGKKRSQLNQIKETVSGELILEESLNLYLHPPPLTEEQKEYRRSDAYYRRKEKQRTKKNIENKENWHKWLTNNSNVLRDTTIAERGKVWNATDYLMYVLSKQQDNRNKWALSHWEKLIPEFGDEVAAAYRDGCVDYWRKYYPEIRSEVIDDPNTTPRAVIVGLSGLEIEAQIVANWPRNLSNDEVKLACRYAVRELNGFPDWLEKLHSVFPSIVEDSISAEIEWEFSKYNGEDICHYVLDDIVWGLDWIKPIISNQIFSFLNNYEPKHDDTIRKALGIVLLNPSLDKQSLISLAKIKVGSVPSDTRQVLWLVSWMCIDAINAAKRLKSILKQMNNKEKATNYFVQFINILLGDKHDSFRSEYHDYDKPKTLLSLIKLMDLYINNSTNTQNGVKEARNQLFQMLKNIPGKQSYLAIMKLANQHPDKDMRRWYAVYAKERAEMDAEIYPWRSGDIVSFAQEAEKTPQNHRELYDLIISRLTDLKDDLEEGDSSNAGLLRSNSDETKHRIYIGGWLRDQSRGRYNTPQEEQLADAKKPDIRIHGVGFDGPVPIELKVADNNWTPTKLVERLKNQLCGQYLRDVHSNCGIFLLIYLGNKKYWIHPKTKKRINFSSLIKFIERNTQEIINKDIKIESLRIIGIDLTKRQ